MSSLTYLRCHLQWQPQMVNGRRPRQLENYPNYNKTGKALLQFPKYNNLLIIIISVIDNN